MEVTKQLPWEDKGRGKAAKNWKNLVSGQACLEFGLGWKKSQKGGRRKVTQAYEGALRATTFREEFLQDTHILSLRG